MPTTAIVYSTTSVPTTFGFIACLNSKVTAGTAYTMRSLRVTFGVYETSGATNTVFPAFFSIMWHASPAGSSLVQTSTWSSTAETAIPLTESASTYIELACIRLDQNASARGNIVDISVPLHHLPSRRVVRTAGGSDFNIASMQSGSIELWGFVSSNSTERFESVCVVDS